MNAHRVAVPIGSRSRLLCLLCLAGLIAVAGCGDRLGKLAPVQGKVTVGNTPLTAGEVRFFPETPKPGVALESNAAIASDGSYTIKTNGKPGAPLGKYKVTVSMPPADPNVPPPAKAPPRPFNVSFEGPDSTTLQLEVVASPSPGQYDLKLTP